VGDSAAGRGTGENPGGGADDPDAAGDEAGACGGRAGGGILALRRLREGTGAGDEGGMRTGEWRFDSQWLRVFGDDSGICLSREEIQGSGKMWKKVWLRGLRVAG